MRDDRMTHATASVLGGAVGMALLRKGMKASESLPIRLQPTRARRNPDEFLVGKLEALRGKPFSRGVRDFMVQALPYGYGMTSGLVFGIATRRRRLRTAPSALVAGVLLGTGVWALSYAGWLPAAKLTPPLTRQGGLHITASLLGHLAFGLVAAAPVLLADRWARRSWWERALQSCSR